MNKYRVTCLQETLEQTSSGDFIMRRVFATRKTFETLESAKIYADTVAESRKPMVGFVDLFTEYTSGHWTVYDPDEYDGPEGDLITLQGDRFDELQAVIDFCEQHDRCTVPYCGVPCGGNPMSAHDEGGSGWKRCDRCGML